MNHRIGLVLVALLGLPLPALACGGLFCGRANPIPVEQSGERILFEIDSLAGTVTTTVDIQYSGDPQAFSWLLPIPTSAEMPVPELAVAPENLLRDLELATRPTITFPPTRCTQSPDPPWVNPVRLSLIPEDDRITVTDLPTVGPFDNELIEASNVGALTAWLDANGYLVSDAMAPALADYVGSGMAFLGVKLVGDAAVTDIAPLSITWPGSEPMIPLRLTSISAEPEMGLFVFIAADEAYGSTNWTTMELDVDRLQWNPVRGQSNYHGLLSYQIDEVGGQGFVLERAERLDQADWPVGLIPTEALLRLGLDYEVVTRLHGRVHPEEMVSDPVFGPMDLSFDGVFDLSDRPRVERCDGAQRAALPCAETYCGVGGECAETASLDGCVCEAGFVARSVRRATRPGVPETATVVCQEDSLDFLGDLGPSAEDACPQDGCGPDGECVVVNGFPTCTCDAGYAAIPEADFLVCAEMAKLWPRDRVVSWTNTTCTGCSTHDQRAPTGALLLLLLGVLRRRSSRRACPPGHRDARQP